MEDQEEGQIVNAFDAVKVKTKILKMTILSACIGRVQLPGTLNRVFILSVFFWMSLGNS